MNDLSGLHIENLEVSYPDWVYAYNLSIPYQGRCALLGESGIGKTTLLLAIAGFAPITKGTMTWNCDSIRDTPANQKPIAMLFQADNLFEHISVRRNISLGLDASVTHNVIEEAAQELGIEKQLDKMPYQLSGGQRQRVAIIRTLLRDEPLVILDEPFTGLDELTKAKTLNWIDRQLSKTEKTLLMVTHQQSDAEALRATVVSI